jgi:L-xylulokinase
MPDPAGRAPGAGGLLLGIDAGQTVTKAVLFDEGGRLVAAARTATTVDSPAPRHQERDMLLQWRQTAAAVRECLSSAGVTGTAVGAVGIVGHNDGVYPVDADGGPVRPAILATDSRAHAYVTAYRESGVAERALELTGQSPFAGSPAAVYGWLRDHEPDTLRRARWLLFCKDWLRLCLTGEAGTDRTEASASFTDVHTQRYSAAALELYGLAPVAELLPPVADPYQVVGAVTREAAGRTGLAAGTPVVAGAHDVDAGALGTGAIGDGAASVVLGTFSINQVVAAEPRLDHRWQARSFLTPGRWLHMSTSASSASNLDWLVRLTGPSTADGAPDFPAALAEAAGAGTGGPLYLPFLYGSPHAVLTGVAFNHRTHVDALRSAFSVDGPVRLSGGGSRGAYWCQLLADTLAVPVEVTDTDEAGARGAALLAGLGTGRYGSLPDAVAAAVRVARRYDPADRAVAALDGDYRRYRAVVDALLAAG